MFLLCSRFPAIVRRSENVREAPTVFIPTILPRVRPRDYWLMSEATDEQIRQLAEASEGAEMSCGVSGSAYHMGLR